MDIVLLALLAFAFAGLIAVVKISLAWSVCLVVMLALIYVSLRYPNGRKDWKYDIRTSAYFLATVILLIIMIYVMYLASGAIIPPPPVTIVLWLSGVILGILVLLSLFFPFGLRVKHAFKSADIVNRHK